MADPKLRFEAEWISRQHCDANGEWNPDRDEYAFSYHASRDEAERAAIIGSKSASAEVEWISVSEQEFRRAGMGAGMGTEWVDVRRWAGDWDGLHDDCVFVRAEAEGD
jgi:hypothetical protein